MLDRDPDCVFCKIAAHEIPSEVVLEDGDVVAFRDSRPVAPLHVLVVPRRHVASAAQADPGTLGKVSAAAARVAREAGRSDYRLVVNVGPGAGQSVAHLHVHVLAGRPFAWPPG